MRFVIIISCLLVNKIVCAQVSVVAPQVNASTQRLSDGTLNIIGTVGEITVLGKSGSQYIGSGFYRSNGFVNLVSNIQEIPKGGIAIYPNPSNGKFTLNSDIPQNGIVEVYNITGTKIFSQNISSLTKTNIDITQNAKGVYLVKVSNAENILTQRIVVE